MKPVTSTTVALLVALAAAAWCGTASADLLSSAGLPILPALPNNCGYVLGVQSGDTCNSLADYNGNDVTDYTALNPLALCGVLTPAPGSLVCVGDRTSTCSTVHTSVAGDTCSSIAASVGAIVGGDLDCSSPLAPGTAVCVRPGANQCNGASLCGVPLTADLRELLGTTPDWCTVLRECQAPLSATTTNGLPSLTATFSSITPAMARVAVNDGHPELGLFVEQRTVGPAQMQIAFVPHAQGDGAAASNFVISSGATGRKLLAVYVRRGQMGYYIPRRY